MWSSRPKGSSSPAGSPPTGSGRCAGTEPFAIQRLDWNGVVPFEIQEINIRKDGFLVTFTSRGPSGGAARRSLRHHHLHPHLPAGYGSPEVDQTTAAGDAGRALRGRTIRDGVSGRIIEGSHPRFRSGDDHGGRRQRLWCTARPITP